MSAPVLAVERLRVHYGKRAAVEDVGFEVHDGDVLLILGHNGAGKTTLLSSIFGLLVPSRGAIRYHGRDIAGRSPTANVSDGISYVPQGHGIFRRLTVRENLMLGALTDPDKSVLPKRIATIHGLFPILKERAGQLAGTMSGGQQQMLAIGIALMHGPRLLILDEPSIGLAPNLVDQVMQGVRRINRELGTTVVLVEQNIEASLPIASRCLILKTGRKVYGGDAAPLDDRDVLMTFF